MFRMSSGQRRKCIFRNDAIAPEHNLASNRSLNGFIISRPDSVGPSGVINYLKGNDLSKSKVRELCFFR